ncbi:glycosyltransferase [Dyadobacter sandarakinus]|uniref:Glycosyltransferase n=2 Tax=Dyadobacter sandarakinus TaxID=2747268 RepID=A0ABX7IDA4_9BACT|nr:glycosyltransferase [Dyadobacter sandarakinus]
MTQLLFMPALEWTILAVLGSYAAFTAGLFVFWTKIKKPAPSLPSADLTISVVIPVRNEAANIGFLLADLDAQTLPKSQYEVFIMDDGSTDTTAEIVSRFASGTATRIHLVPLTPAPTASPKKRAIETAIGMSESDLIVTTDGDCRVEPGWLAAIASARKASGARLISGPVTFTSEHLLTDHLQTVEFASLVGSGACSIQAGYPSMCNGANLAYDRTVFMEVGGFDGVRHIASGDDEFLMHKVAARFPGQIHFLKSQDAIVKTAPHRSWKAFFRQRKRWASKWKHYKSRTPLVLALFIFTCNFSLLAGCALSLAGLVSPSALVWMLLLKCLPEWLFLGSVLIFLKKPASALLIPLTQVFYPLYVCFFGLAAQNPTYEWKGRKLV